MIIEICVYLGADELVFAAAGFRRWCECRFANLIRCFAESRWRWRCDGDLSAVPLMDGYK